MYESTQRLARREERFAQTAVGWMLRNLEELERKGRKRKEEGRGGEGEKRRAVAFIEKNAERLSAEAIRTATEKMERREQLRLREVGKRAKRGEEKGKRWEGKRGREEGAQTRRKRTRQ